MHQFAQGLSHRGKGLIEICGNIGDARPLGRFAGKTERGARLINVFQRLGNLRVCHVEGFTFLIEILRTRHLGREQAFGPIKLRLREDLRCLGLLPRGRARTNQRDLIVHVLNRVGEFETQAPRRGHFTAHGGLGHHEVRLRGIDRGLLDRDLHAIRLRVQLDQHVALLHPVVILDQHPSHLTHDARCDEGHIAVHIGIIGRDGVQRVDDSWDDDEENNKHSDRDQDIADAMTLGQRESVRERVSAAKSKAEAARSESVSILQST